MTKDGIRVTCESCGYTLGWLACDAEANVRRRLV